MKSSVSPNGATSGFKVEMNLNICCSASVYNTTTVVGFGLSLGYSMHTGVGGEGAVLECVCQSTSSRTRRKLGADLIIHALYRTLPLLFLSCIRHLPLLLLSVSESSASPQSVSAVTTLPPSTLIDRCDGVCLSFPWPSTLRKTRSKAVLMGFYHRGLALRGITVLTHHKRDLQMHRRNT